MSVLSFQKRDGSCNDLACAYDLPLLQIFEMCKYELLLILLAISRRTWIYKEDFYRVHNMMSRQDPISMVNIIY